MNGCRLGNRRLPLEGDIQVNGYWGRYYCSSGRGLEASDVDGQYKPVTGSNRRCHAVLDNPIMGWLFGGSNRVLPVTPAPEFISPMKATLVGQLPAGDD